MKTKFVEQVNRKEKNKLYADLLAMIRDLINENIKVKSFEDGILIGAYKKKIKYYTNQPLSIIFKFIEDDENIMEQIDHVVLNMATKFNK